MKHLLTIVGLANGLVRPNLRLHRSLRMAASVEPSKSRDDDIGQLKAKIEILEAKIEIVEAKIENVEAALGGHSDDISELSNQLSQLQQKEIIPLTLDQQSSSKQLTKDSEDSLSDQQPLNVVGEFVDIVEKGLAGFTVNMSRFYLRSESVDLWNKIEEVTDKGDSLRVSGPPGIGKSTEVWAWALWKAKTARKKVIWFHISTTSGFITRVVLDGEANKGIPYPLDATIFESIETSDGDLLVVDGVSEKMRAFIHQACLNWRRAKQKERASFITVSSVPYEAPLTYSQNTAVHSHLVPSWDYDDYEAACQDTDFYESIKKTLLQESDGDDIISDKNDLLQRKYYYAGGCARYMFELDIEKVIAEIDGYLAQVTSYEDILFPRNK